MFCFFVFAYFPFEVDSLKAHLFFLFASFLVFLQNVFCIQCSRQNAGSILFINLNLLPIVRKKQKKISSGEHDLNLFDRIFFVLVSSLTIFFSF